MSEKELERKLKRYTRRNFTHTRRYLIERLTEDENFIAPRGIMLKEDIIEQYALSRKAAGRKIFNYDFSLLPEFITGRNEKFKIIVPYISTKTKNLIPIWITNYHNFITGMCDNGSLSGMESKYKTKQFTGKQGFIKKSQEKFGEGTFDYSKVNYINLTTPVLLLCPTCGKEYYQTPLEHLDSIGVGCPECAMKHSGEVRMFMKEQLIEILREKFGDDFWNLDTFTYTGANKPVSAVRNDTGELIVRNSWYAFLNYDPDFIDSNGNARITRWLKSHDLQYESEYYLPNFKYTFDNKEHKIRVDFYLKKLGTIIEFNGIQHYKSVEVFNKGRDYNVFERQQLRDRILRSYCRENNISLIEIPYLYNTEEKLFLLLDQLFIQKLPIDDILVDPFKQINYEK